MFYFISLTLGAFFISDLGVCCRNFLFLLQGSFASSFSVVILLFSVGGSNG
jgi:hypothetical protein